MDPDTFSATLILITLGVIYFLPSIVANTRNHRSAGAVVALNLFLGWTFIGWVIALVWALAYQPQDTPTAGGR